MTGQEKPKKQRISTRGVIEQTAQLLSVEGNSELVVLIDKESELYYQELALLVLETLIRVDSQNLEHIEHAMTHLHKSVPNSIKDEFVSYLVRRALVAQVSELRANIPVRASSASSPEEIAGVDDEKPL